MERKLKRTHTKESDEEMKISPSRMGGEERAEDDDQEGNKKVTKKEDQKEASLPLLFCIMFVQENERIVCALVLVKSIPKLK